MPGRSVWAFFYIQMMKNGVLLLLVAVRAALLLFRFPKDPGEAVVAVSRTDTLVRVDTVVHTVFKPYRVTEVRTDTLVVYIDRPVSEGDSLPVALPVEEVRYKEEDYELTIGGWRPYLKSLTVYPRTVEVTNTEIQTVIRRPRFGVGVQVGYGTTGNEIRPYIGFGIQYHVFNF